MLALFLATLSHAAELPELPFEKYTLSNGLEVVLHVDRSDPIVALATLVHVGSSREEVGRTGFAHFFEHMSFNDSENVPRGSNRKRIEELGGSRNGGTSNDFTYYYEVVPADALEKLLWIDSDRLGYMINTVTVPALENEKQVVKNEKRQRVDNAPYGFERVVVSETLYPAGHPYSWPVIGSLEDLQRATLDDVRTFYDRWYGPNNATLVVAGDFDVDRTKQLIEAYFGEIRRGPDVVDPEPQPVSLAADVKLSHLDAFAKLPQLRITLPTVEQYHPDAAALDVLGQLLADGKRAPLYQTVVEAGLAPSVSAGHDASELAGTFGITVRANEGVDLDAVQAAVQAGLDRFAAEGFEDRDLARIKTETEVRSFNRVASVLGKAFQLAYANEFAGDPAAWRADTEALLAVTRDDVMRVFRTYVHQRPAVYTSFVPADQPALALEGARAARVDIEEVVKGAEAPPAEIVVGDYERTPTTFDRSSEPPFGELPDRDPPSVWSRTLRRGVEVTGMVQDELPLVSFSLTVEGGHRLDPEGQDGLVALMASTLNEGTRRRTPEQLQDAIGQLGATIRVSAGDDAFTVSASGLARDLDALAALATEMLLQPRFDPTEFERLKAEQLTAIAGRASNPSTLASMVLDRALYGAEHPYGTPATGTAQTVAPLTLTDVKAAHKRLLSSATVSVQVVGAVEPDDAVRAFTRLDQGLRPRAVPVPEVASPEAPEEPTLWFVDVPGSKQSVLRVGTLAVAADDPQKYDIDVANNRLGGGSSARLFQLLRIDKGYTYGAYSGLSARTLIAPLTFTTSVRANVTRESLELLREQIATYADTFGPDDLDTTRTLLAKREALDFETLGARLGHLQELALYGLPHDTLSRRKARLATATLDEVQGTIRTWFDPRRLTYVVVGDGPTQRAEVEALGLPVIDVDFDAMFGPNTP